MYKTITNLTEYVPKCDVEKLPIDYSNMIKKQIFNHDVKLYPNPWLWHLHLKCADVCNASCSFCVEKSCRGDKQLPDKFLENTDKMLFEMYKNNILYSVSITGGEPTLFSRLDDLLNILSHYDIKFLTMNTNAAMLEKYIDKVDTMFDFVDISRHSIHDKRNDEIFGTKILPISELKRMKDHMQHCKMRIQCVALDINNIYRLLEFIDKYSFADDLSFRRLMKLSDEYNMDYDINEFEYDSFINYALNHWKFKEQTIQDYYVYEIYNTGCVDVTFSYSNMKMVRDIEKQEPKDIFREFIIHPDGAVSGSWKKDCKILLS